MSTGTQGIEHYLENPDALVRRAAVELAGKLAKEGNLQAIGWALQCLEDADAGVRLCALEAMKLVAQAGGLENVDLAWHQPLTGVRLWQLLRTGTEAYHGYRAHRLLGAYFR